MKTLLTLAALLLLASPAIAQQETLFEGELEHAGYGGPAVMATIINDSPALFFGGGGGWIINHTFSVSAFGYGLINELSADGINPDDSRRLEMSYGGLSLQYIHASDNLVHFTANLLLGGGGLNYRLRTADLGGWEWQRSRNVDDMFLVVEPGIDVELNVFTNARLALGGSYRLVSGIDLPEYSNETIGGATGHLIFKFGSF